VIEANNGCTRRYVFGRPTAREKIGKKKKKGVHGAKN